MNSCKIDKAKAFSFITSYVNGDSIEKALKINSEIKVEGGIEVKYYKGKKPVRTSLESALNFAFQNKKDLIQDKKKFYIAPKAEYIEQKKVRVYYHYMIHCLMINRNDIYANRNKTNRRLDSNLTIFPSSMIPFISLDGEPLVGIDLSNSQFVFLAALIEEGCFEEYIKEARKNSRKLILASSKTTLVGAHSVIYESNGGEIEIKGIRGEGGKERVQGEGGIKKLDTYMCAKMEVIDFSGGKKRGFLKGDIAQFVDLARSGKLYEFIQKELNLGTGEAGRKRAKNMMFEIFFSSDYNRGTQKKRVKGLFPELVGMIDSYKKDMKEKRKNGQLERGEKCDGLGHNQFAITLQKKESEVFIDKILFRLHKMGFKALSKHDSVLCKKSEVATVKAIVKSVLNEELGKGNYQLKEI